MGKHPIDLAGNSKETSKADHRVDRLEKWSTQDIFCEILVILLLYLMPLQKKVLTGLVLGYTDLLGTGGIVMTDAERGFDNVKVAIPFPQDPEKFKEKMSHYLFQIED